MKRILSTTAIAAMLLGGTAYAESHSTEGEAMTETSESTNDGAMQTDAMSGDGPFGASDIGDDAIFASDFIGKRIYGAEGEVGDMVESGVNQEWDDLGEINDVIMGSDGQVDLAVLGIGGFLGIGERDVLVKMDALQIVQDGQNPNDFLLVINATQEQIEAAPEFDRDAMMASDMQEQPAEGTAMEEDGSMAEPAAEGEEMMNDAETATDEAMESTEDAAEGAVESTEEAAEGAADATENAAEDAAEETGEAIEETGDAVEDATDEATTAN